MKNARENFVTMPRTAIWKSIADTLTADIAGGQYRSGDKLPTEAALARRFGVNRHTVRHALSALAAAGTVHARRGSGVYVASVPTDYPLGRRVRFHQNVTASGRTPMRRLLRLETRLADARECEALALPSDATVHVVEGLSFADDVPIAMFRSVFPAQRFPGLLAAMARSNSVTAALADGGLADYTRASTRLTASAATALQALHLHLPEGAPVLQSVGMNIDDAGTPVEFGTTWFAGDRVTIAVQPD
jgi:GntR family transcriptional regulator, phosphonate transport system regulatory protein